MENTQPQMQGHGDCVEIQNEHNCAGVQRTAFNWFSEDNTTLMQEDTFKGSWKIEVKRKWMWVQTYFGIRAGKGPSTDLLLNLPCNDFFTNCFNCLFPTEISIKKKKQRQLETSLCFPFAQFLALLHGQGKQGTPHRCLGKYRRGVWCRQLLLHHFLLAAITWSYSHCSIETILQEHKLRMRAMLGVGKRTAAPYRKKNLGRMWQLHLPHTSRSLDDTQSTLAGAGIWSSS